MNREMEQYRFARIEGYRITHARLQEQFVDKGISFEALECAVALELAATLPCAPWRKSEIEQVACREGMRLAALEFFWENHQAMRHVQNTMKFIKEDYLN